MSFLASVVKPLAYISLPVLLFRSIANTSPVGRYYWRASIFLGSLVVVSTWGIVVAVGMTLIGRRHDVNYVVARTFYNLVSRVLEIKVEVEGEEYLQTRPAVMVGNHQSMLDILYLGRSAFSYSLSWFVLNSVRSGPRMSLDNHTECSLQERRSWLSGSSSGRLSVLGCICRARFSLIAETAQEHTSLWKMQASR